MNPRFPRWIPLASFAAALVLATSAAQAFTDVNAELKEVAADAANRVVVVGKAAPPVRTVWVPASPKSLDGFRPVLADEAATVAGRRPTLVAKAEARAAASKR
jgi:hypothetical protein